MTEEHDQDIDAADTMPAEIIADHAETPKARASTVTYSPEDNKLRLYVGRVPRDEYEALRKGGWTSTPKQSCDFVATWTPAREDQAREYLDDGEDIGDEDYSPEERSADRAERFGGYLDKRRAEAGFAADTHASGPTAFGHQNRARAERQARRHDRHRTYALSQWSKAEYWERRTAGVIAHALYKSSAHVRRGRVVKLESELRQAEKSHAEYIEKFKKWQTVPTLDGADTDIGTKTHAGTAAYLLANGTYDWFSKFKHPRQDTTGSLYDLMTKGDDPITPREAAALWLEGRRDPETDTESNSYRWREHYKLRLTYERAMLANEGGMAGEADMIPGGWFRAESRRNPGEFGEWRQIIRVHKSPATKRVTSVTVKMMTYRDRYGNPFEDGQPREAEARYDVERRGENCYRPPTETELKEFQESQKREKAAAKATKKPEPPLINPTLADAERLQRLWNSRAKKNENPGEVLQITQAQYSANSKGDYAPFETRTIDAEGKPSRRSSNLWTSEGQKYDATLKETVCKVRARSNGWGVCRVVFITDKPSKPIPLKWEEIEAKANQEAAA